MNEFARILWKIVGERCNKLEKFIIPKELTYSSTLNSVIGGSSTFDWRDKSNLILLSISFYSQWILFDAADPQEEHPQQHVPPWDRVPLPQPARARHCRGRSGHGFRNGKWSQGHLLGISELFLAYNWSFILERDDQSNTHIFSNGPGENSQSLYPVCARNSSDLLLKYPWLSSRCQLSFHFEADINAL